MKGSRKVSSKRSAISCTARSVAQALASYSTENTEALKEEKKGEFRLLPISSPLANVCLSCSHLQILWALQTAVLWIARALANEVARQGSPFRKVTFTTLASCHRRPSVW